eukprot:scaffold19832_cov115-Skeletonema_marinoi.AAC.1
MLILKAIDHITDDVKVGQSYVKKSKWEKVIPETRDRFKHHLYPLFQCHAHLDMFLNVENKLVMAGTNCDEVFVFVKDTNEKVELSSLIPILNVEDVQTHINMLWRFNQGTLLYLSAGAGRGLELTRIGPFKYFQEYFNCLRFTMRSEKNVLHGVDRNKKNPHFVPPSLSRYIIILNMVIYPAVEQSQTLTIPSIDR